MPLFLYFAGSFLVAFGAEMIHTAQTIIDEE